MDLLTFDEQLDKYGYGYYIAPMLKNVITAQSLSGVWTAMVTPFKNKGLNLKTLDILIGKASESGVRGVIVLGTTGESPTVTPEEREQIISKAVAISAKRIPIFVGAGSNDTRHALHQINQAERLGADGLLIVTPYYNKPTEAGLREYYLTLADSTKLPIILYHIPGRCGVGISVKLALELARHPNIIGLKDAGGDVTRVSELSRLAPTDFAILSGDDGLTLPMLSVGARGVVSVLSNIVPEQVVNMVGLALGGQFGEALEIHRKLTPLCQALFLETSPAPIKEALRLAGIDAGRVRPPLTSVTSATRRTLRKALSDLGLVA